MSLYGDLPPAKTGKKTLQPAAWTPALMPRKAIKKAPPPIPRALLTAMRSKAKPKRVVVKTTVVKSPNATSTVTTEPASMLQASIIVDEYDPSKPNDYEELLVARERKKKQDAEDRRLRRERERREAEAREAEERRKASMPPPSFQPPMAKTGFSMPAPKPAGGFSMPAPKGRSSGGSAPAAKKPKMDLRVSADEAYARRQRMSRPQATFTLGSAVIPKAKAPVPQFAAPSGRSGAVHPSRQGQVPRAQPPARAAASPSYKNSQINTTSPTRVVLLRNMVGRNEVDAELQREVAEECQKFGRVVKCVVYPVPGHVPDAEAVRIFVQFGSIKSAVAAMEGLNGRFFAGRTVKSSYYSELKLTMKQYMA